MSQIIADLQVRISQQTGIRLEAEFGCRAGEVLAVVGPSGGGKSTLLRMIAGLNHPQQGRICHGPRTWFDSEQRLALSPQQRHIGYVPQHFGLFPRLTALENVLAGLDHLPKAERLHRARTALERVNLQGLDKRLPAQLSGGQKQRVALARALAREPSVLLLDEPFSAVDRETRERLYLELARLRQELAIPVILVTHDLNEALLLADRMLLLSQGQLLQQGPPQEVFARPRTEAVARQLGLRNIFDGRVLANEKDGCWLGFGDQRLFCANASHRAEGSRVRWLIPNQGIRFSALAPGHNKAQGNELPLSIDTALPLGDSLRLEASISGCDASLATEVPLHLARRLGLSAGVKTQVHLRPDLLHILES
ncbi:ABC transporter ATP-binding protein [Shewanella cyperi]|uniref:ABC transporter ATP-binding protein n=1 Tax=Shewanella cyperi TaxID=2814292 RepID=A0A974XKA5_9GAMM|nr:ABC transporter ATP-binding protein [Shewanella cyperi]QSX30005.1 ABC transporter ATP-binding protein [Shewanella cyperi]